MLVFRGGIFPRLVAIFPLVFPLYLFRGNFLGIPVTLPEVLLGFMFLYFLFREKPNFREFLVWPVLMIIVAAIISVIISPALAAFVDGSAFLGQERAMGIFKGWIFFPIVYFFMARFYFREKPGLILSALRALAISGLFLSFYALYQVFTQNFITADMRASGPFESANYLALYLGPIIVFCITALFKKEAGFFDRIFLGFSLIICGLALYFTKSYAAWISVFAAIFVGTLFIIRNQSKNVRVIFLVSFALGVVLLFYSQMDTEKFQQFIDFSSRSSSTVRLQVYEIAWALIKENPVFGIGLGQFEHVYQTKAVEILGHTPFEWVMIHPHNVFLAFWLNLGILGLSGFLWLSYKALLWLYERDTKERALAALMLVGILVHGLFDTPIFKNDLAFEFWLIMAILI